MEEPEESTNNIKESDPGADPTYKYYDYEVGNEGGDYLSEEDDNLSELSSSDEEPGSISVKRYLNELFENEPKETSPPRNSGFKVSISNLPGSMGVQDFFNYFGDLPPHNYFFYKPALRSGSAAPFCAAVINFLNKEDVAFWIESIDGITIVDHREVEYEVECEIMENQDLPKPPVVTEVDPLQGTMEETEEYLEFQDHYEDTDGVFADPPVTLDLLQETMLREIAERKSREHKFQDTPIVKHIFEKLAAEREKSRQRDEAAEELRKAKEKRRSEGKEQRDKESKDGRRERMAKEKLRKEAARRARKAAKLESKKQSPLSKPESSVVSTPRGGDDPAGGTASSAVLDVTPQSAVVSDVSPGIHDISSSSKEKSRGRGGGRSNRNSNRNWGDREMNWRSTKPKGDTEKSSKTPQSAEADVQIQNSIGANIKSDEKVVSSGLTTEDRTHQSASTATVSIPNDGKREPKKKIVKKIVKVKKVKSGETIATVVVPPEGGASGSKAAKTETSAESTSSRVKSATPSSSSTVIPPTVSSDGSKPVDTREKSKRSRPDREVYRPGAWRRSSGQAQKQETDTSSSSKPTTSTKEA